MFKTIGESARFFVSLEYPDAEIRENLARMHPQDDVDDALDKAHRWKRERDRELEAVLADQDRRAVLAEHTDRSMHDD